MKSSFEEREGASKSVVMFSGDGGVFLFYNRERAEIATQSSMSDYVKKFTRWTTAEKRSLGCEVMDEWFILQNLRIDFMLYGVVNLNVALDLLEKISH